MFEGQEERHDPVYTPGPLTPKDLQHRSTVLGPFPGKAPTAV